MHKVLNALPKILRELLNLFLNIIQVYNSFI